MKYLVFKNDGSVVECKTPKEVLEINPAEYSRCFRGNEIVLETKSVLAFKKSKTSSDDATVSE